MLRNIMSVVIGVIIAAALFSLAALIMLLTIASKVKGHGEESDLDGISKVFDVVSFLVIFTCCFIGGYITGRISTKKDMIHGAITGIVLIVLLAYASDFDKSTEAIIYYVVILPFTLIGTLMAVRVKKRKKLI
ncbi:MAG: TIGR04086 family membrane protein [Chitinophagaceae bacterium]|nr:TIGR04086 family membrane protein [Chitinophagaceae bacterium]MBK7679257.1 TIGR04086 family membrane protein [Chitinophagaceae bacterium]MBK8299403.1 TIGR04086 family membrane protein [Chitinophagaceae bacterium]MBK9463452.1 TIGR04086 family membrane protein [Chitinophagaceae bacterium]MBK9659428.1 TIGR04086 family membrane protein [Chitinophagaceae bacterium]